jgi:CybS, succinate dehydrogenase cytochrome B small subunit
MENRYRIWDNGLLEYLDEANTLTNAYLSWTDYFPKHKTPVMNRLMKYTLTTATAGILVGCYQFNMHDIGITELIARTWTA